MPSANGDIDVTRREHEEIAHVARENSKELAAIGEWRKHRDKELDGLFTLVREIKDDIRITVAPIAEMVKTHAGTLANFDNKMTILSGEIAALKAENSTLQAEMKVSVGLRSEYFAVRDEFKAVKEAEKTNTAARIKAETEKITLEGLLKTQQDAFDRKLKNTQTSLAILGVSATLLGGFLTFLFTYWTIQGHKLP